MRKLVPVALALVLAGCGGRQATSLKGPPLPTLAERCGEDPGTTSRTLWFAATDGTRLDGAELGSGARGVVLLHESPGELCGWEPYGATLARNGFHVLLVDLRTFGMSGRGPRGGARGAIADVHGAVRELKRLGAKRVALVGASYGGVTALVAAPALGSNVAGVASLSGELALPNSQLDALAAVPGLRAPLLVMGSRGDPLLDEPAARKLMRRVGSRQKSLVMFDGTGHGWDLLIDRPTRKRADARLEAFLRGATE